MKLCTILMEFFHTNLNEFISMKMSMRVNPLKMDVSFIEVIMCFRIF